MTELSEYINNFVIRIANVNGTGSASANFLLAKSIFQYGIPIGPKNIFPSNIQGLPTWYEIRISEKGFTGRLGKVHIVCSMNPQSFSKDLNSVCKNGFFIYDSTKYLDQTKLRKDIGYIPLPITDLCNVEFSSYKKLIPLLKNIFYVGAISYLIDLPEERVCSGLEKSFSTKKALLDLNKNSLSLGFQYAKKHFPEKLPYKLSPKNLTADKIILEGNNALALGAIYAGATVCSWYPITPSTSVVESFKGYCERWRKDDEGKNQYAIVQAEDEIAAIGMVLGASWHGARAFTATSGPGLSLMNEFIGYSYYAEIPSVIFLIQRTGPSTGMPTRTQQADLISAAYASHGDTKHILLFPGTIEECFEFSHLAFDLADIYQTTILVMSDLELGMNQWMSSKISWSPSKITHNRGKVLNFEDLEKSSKPFNRYDDLDGDGISYRTYPNTHPSKGAFLNRGSGHDKLGRYTEDPDLYVEVMEKIKRKINGSINHIPKPLSIESDPDNKVLLLYQGAIQDVLKETQFLLNQEKNLQINTLRIRSFPFHHEIEKYINSHKKIIVLDQNRDHQLASLLSIELELNPKNLIKIQHYDGMPLTAYNLLKLVIQKIGEPN